MMYDEPMHHHLKCWPKYFNSVVSGIKTFEYRINDRNFMVGDHVTLEEWCPVDEKYTGRISEHTIGYVLHGGAFGLPNNMCIFSLLPL